MERGNWTENDTVGENQKEWKFGEEKSEWERKGWKEETRIVMAGRERTDEGEKEGKDEGERGIKDGGDFLKGRVRRGRKKSDTSCVREERVSGRWGCCFLLF